MPFVSPNLDHHRAFRLCPCQSVRAEYADVTIDVQQSEFSRKSVRRLRLSAQLLNRPSPAAPDQTACSPRSTSATISSSNAGFAAVALERLAVRRRATSWRHDADFFRQLSM